MTELFFKKKQKVKSVMVFGMGSSKFKKNQYLKILKASILGEKKILKGGMAFISFHSVLTFSCFWALTITLKSSKPLHTWLGPVLLHLALVVRRKWCMTEVEEEDIMHRYP